MSKQNIRFVLICEGKSDEALVTHLQRLLIHSGAIEAAGTFVDRSTLPRPNTGSSAIGTKVETLLASGWNPDLWFIHRDADGTDYTARLAEIEKGVKEAGLEADWLAVIPVREMEAWVLLDEAVIRRVAGKPKGKTPLGLPKAAQVEDISDPKKALEEALCKASGSQGHRLKRFRKRFGELRRILLEQLPVGGQLEQVPAWCRLKQAVDDFVNDSAN